MTNAITNAVENIATNGVPQLSPEAIETINTLAANRVPILVILIVVAAIVIFKG